MTTTRSKEPLMTGLDPATDAILQICCFITDHDLNLIDQEGWGTVVHQPKVRLDAMNEWCVRTHAATGLTAAVLASTTTADEAATGLLQYIQHHVPESHKALLAGNSIHADRAFLAQPPYDKVLRHLHYRLLDVSSIKEAVRRWATDAALKAVPAKRGMHEAREDILESIAEARFYKERFLSR
ncbi:MAG: hypothetical protein M1838_004385 [Thelocarpon superellum]|nr:MAG: hypothetical protein M1838_004385 [Thelocarpon superellum]